MNAPLSPLQQQLLDAASCVAYLEAIGCTVLNIDCSCHLSRASVWLYDAEPLYAHLPEPEAATIRSEAGSNRLTFQMAACDVSWIVKPEASHA